MSLFFDKIINFRKKGKISLVFLIAFCLLFFATISYGATTLTSYIETSGNINSSSALAVTGDTNLYSTTTLVGTGSNLVVEGTGTSTFTGGLEASVLNITSSSATSTFTNGLQLISGCILDPSGVCSDFSETGTINTGNSGYLSYYSSTGTTLDDTLSSNGGLFFDSSNQ